MDAEDRILMKYILSALLVVLFGVALILFSCPFYNRWSAEQEMKTQILRATGDAKVQEIIDSTLSNRYIRWLEAQHCDE